jgi:hypothetical protein
MIVHAFLSSQPLCHMVLIPHISQLSLIFLIDNLISNIHCQVFIVVHLSFIIHLYLLPLYDSCRPLQRSEDQKQQQTAVTYASIALHTSLNHDVKHPSESLKCVKKSVKKIENKTMKEKLKDCEYTDKMMKTENSEVLGDDSENGYGIDDSYITEITNTEFDNSKNNENSEENVNLNKLKLNSKMSSDDNTSWEYLPQQQITEVSNRKGKYYVIRKVESLYEEDKYVSKKVSQKEKLNQNRIPKSEKALNFSSENNDKTKHERNMMKFASKSSDRNDYFEIFQKFSKTDLFQFRNFDPKMKLLIFEILVRYRNLIYLKKSQVRNTQNILY